MSEVPLYCEERFHRRPEAGSSWEGLTCVKAMGAMALLSICDRSFTCEDYNTYRAHPWSLSPLRRAHPGPGPHNMCGGQVMDMIVVKVECSFTFVGGNGPGF